MHPQTENVEDSSQVSAIQKIPSWEKGAPEKSNDRESQRNPESVHKHPGGKKKAEKRPEDAESQVSDIYGNTWGEGEVCKGEKKISYILKMDSLR